MDTEAAECLQPVANSFSNWAYRVRAEAASQNAVRAAGLDGSGEPHFSPVSCARACCSLLMVVDRYHGAAFHQMLLSRKVFQVLGEGSAADWEGISERLAQQAGTQEQDPAWLHDPEQCDASVHARLHRAACSSEVSVLMLRLALRTACFGSSWYGPWSSREALDQLVTADAWSSLAQALKAILQSFGGPKLAKQYNAVNIVSDILHVSPLLSVPHVGNGVVDMPLVLATAARYQLLLKGSCRRRSSMA